MKYQSSSPQFSLTYPPLHPHYQFQNANSPLFDSLVSYPNALLDIPLPDDKVRYLHDQTQVRSKIRGFVAVFRQWEKELCQMGITTQKLQSITEQEGTIIHKIASGLQTKEIADALFISEHTVQTHRKNINKKLGINSAVTLVKVSMLLNLL